MFMKFVCVLVFGVLFAMDVAAQPNIVLLLIDDMGYGDIAAHGNPLIKTPNFDRLRSQSLSFDDFLVSPTCSPTRAALMTGMHELHSGVTHTIAGRNRMDLDAVTLPQVLKRAGYHTAIFGKWHLGIEEEAYRPYRRGFDIALNEPRDNQRSHYDPVLIRNGQEEKHTGYRTDIFFNEAMDYIEERVGSGGGGKPFFCYLATFTPHSPRIVPEKYTEPYVGKSEYPEYHGMVANVDENLGRLMAKLDALGIAEDTLLIVMGDNGGTFGIDTWNAGMRGAKGNAYLGAVRTFSFWRWLKRIAPGVRDQLAAHHDVLPTLAAVTGAELEPSHRKKLEGHDLSPLFNEDRADWPGQDRMVIHHATRYPDGKAAEHKYVKAGVRWGKYHLLRQVPCDNPSCGLEFRNSICNNSHKRLLDPELPGFYADKWHYELTALDRWSLYDLASDPSQERDIAVSQPEVVDRMARHFDMWWERNGFD
jgi:arylsulfatase A-like enzyme